MFDLTKSVILFINYQYLPPKINIKNNLNNVVRIQLLL